MNVVLKKLSEADGRDVYEMIREIGPGENRFTSMDRRFHLRTAIRDRHRA